MGYEKFSRPVLMPAIRRLSGLVATTSAATLKAKGVYGFETAKTSSQTSDVWTLGTPKPGDQLTCVAMLVASSSVAPIHINTATSCAFSYSSSATAHDMATLSSNGAGFDAIALNSSEWLVTAVRGASFSTST